MKNPLHIDARLRSALLLVLAISSRSLVAQKSTQPPTLTGTIILHVTSENVPVPGVTVATGTANSVTDQSGAAKFTLPTGRRTFHVTPAGFRPESLAVYVGVGMTSVNVPVHRKQTTSTSIPGVFVASTRDTRHVAEPTRPRAVAITRQSGVKVSDKDVLEEEFDASTGAVSDVLARASGVRIQPLSAGSAGAGIRIRGMPSHYTKILMDDLPLYGATPEGLESQQISTLDLQRIEITKGVASALYGPSALSGAVNFVSAPPTSPSEVVVGGSSRLGSDVAVWQTHTFSPKWSASLEAGRHFQNPNDTDGDGWTDVNGYRRITARPRVYWNRDERSSWFMTGAWMSENRRSGTFEMARLPDFNRYSDDADTRHADVGTVGRIQLDSNSLLTIRASTTREWRARWFGDNQERNRRSTVFTDVALTKTLGEHAVVMGAGLERDQYVALDTRDGSYRYTTPALFAQHTWTPDSWFAVTSSARLDLQSEVGDFVSPRISVVAHPSEPWTFRLSAAKGVYAPTLLTEETEAFGMSHLRRTNREAEHATGWSLDADRVRGALELRASVYQTVVAHPMILRTIGEELRLVNADDPTRTQGADVSLRYRARPIRFTASYSYIDATRPEIGLIVGEDFQFDTTMRRVVPLNPRHAVNLELAHERPNNRLIGVEAHLAGTQAISDTATKYSQPYVTIDARLEKHVRRTVVFVRGLNLTNVHQSQFSPVIRNASGPAGQWTNDVWAPLDGFAVSAGLRLKY